MAESRINLTGVRVGGDPELRYTSGGQAVANFSVAFTPRVKKGGEWVDGETAWFRCAAWGQLGENVAAEIGRGDMVDIVGRFGTRTFEKDGVSKTSMEITVESIGQTVSPFPPRDGGSKRSSGASTSGGDQWYGPGQGGAAEYDADVPF